MVEAIQIPHTLWDIMMQMVNNRLVQGKLDKPIVFALYTSAHNHYEVIDYKEIATVKVTGDYPNGEYKYTYPGIKEQGFYPPTGSGKWFSGTLVAGDDVDLDEEDKKWMIRDKMDFRIKMDRDSLGQWSWKAFYIDFPIAPVELK